MAKKGFIAEFKEFIARGNVMDLAVGVIIGGAFQSIVNSLVNDMIMPVISLLTGGVNFSNWVIRIGSGENDTIKYGNFITAVINFLLMALVIFCFVKVMNNLASRTEKLLKKEEEAPAAEEEETENHSLTFEGRCWKFGNDIDTDIIIPTQHLNYETMDEIKVHAFEPLRPELAAKLREGDLIVAGNNFGCGSSREQAAEVLVANGVHCVIAKSFARIFFRNAINNGILLLECPDLPDDVNEGDTVKVELDKQQISANGKTYKIPAIPENLYHIIMDGGLVKSIMKKVEKGLL